MWDVAYAGGWTPRAQDVIRRIGRASAIPPSIRVAATSALARLVRRRTPPGEHQLVKSVLAGASIEWIAARYRPRVVVVWRSPLNMLASLLDLGQQGAMSSTLQQPFIGTPVWPPPDDDVAARVLWKTCAKQSLLLGAANRHPDWLVFRHEDLTSDPPAAFRRVFADLGLTWSHDVEVFLRSSNRAGTGWETARIARDEATVWMRRLTSEQIESGRRVLARFAMLPDVGSSFARCLDETFSGETRISPGGTVSEPAT